MDSELKSITGGEVIKLQKPIDNTFSNIVKNDEGIEIGTCNNCGAKNVEVKEHICQTLLKPEKMITTIKEFKNYLKSNK